MDRRPRGVPERSIWDDLAPFVPPVLRVSRETRQELYARATDVAQWQELMRRLQAAAKEHGKALFRVGLVSIGWLAMLYYVHRNAHEFAAAFVVVSGLVGVMIHVCGGPRRKEGEWSAYSVFNRGTQRLLGTLSAEQFEQEIRHVRMPDPDEDPNPDDDAVLRRRAPPVEEEEDAELLLAMQLSLQEKKREDRRSRRTRRQ